MKPGPLERIPADVAFMFRFNVITAALSWPPFLWVAITQAWVVFFVPLVLTAEVGIMWLSLHRE